VSAAKWFPSIRSCACMSAYSDNQHIHRHHDHISTLSCLPACLCICLGHVSKLYPRLHLSVCLCLPACLSVCLSFISLGPWTAPLDRLAVGLPVPAKQGPDVLFRMPDRTNCILLISPAPPGEPGQCARGLAPEDDGPAGPGRLESDRRTLGAGPHPYVCGAGLRVGGHGAARRRRQRRPAGASSAKVLGDF
jgi:hypothetical protein